VSGDAVAMDYGQVEDGAFATTPILTTTSTATRSADFATMSTLVVQSWRDLFKGTFLSESYSSTFFGNRVVVDQNLMPGLKFSGATAVLMISNVADYSTVSYSVTPNQNLKAAASFRPGGLSLAIQNRTDSRSIQYVVQPIGGGIVYIGNGQATAYLNGTLARLCYLPKALTVNELLELTK
jgi:hypothetical protein